MRKKNVWYASYMCNICDILEVHKVFFEENWKEKISIEAQRCLKFCFKISKF